MRFPQFVRRMTRLDGFWWIAGIVAILVVSNLFSWICWGNLRGDEESLSSTIRNLGLVQGGFIAIVLAVWRSIVAQRQAETAQQGLLNDRYQQGAEMLGNEVLSVRLGGIYALQRLAEEHPEQYHVQIMQLFCSYARNPTRDDDVEGTPEAEEKPTHTNPSPREDVQAVMQAVGTCRRRSIALERKAGFELDLGLADLRGVNIRNSNLSSANLNGANLVNVLLIDVDLSGAHLRKANLSSASLGSVNLSGARLWEADMSSVFLNDVDLSAAKLGGVIITDAFLGNADLSGAFLMGAKNLTQAQLNLAHADTDKPPELSGLVDPETGERLVWRN